MSRASDESDGTSPVPSELYTREYYTSDCEGFSEFLQGALELPERIKESMELAGDMAGREVLDVGCGRGELVCRLAMLRAHAVGVDYAEAAVELAGELASSLPEEVRGNARFIRSDAKGLPFDDNSFDTVFFVDVYEHLQPDEIEVTLVEIRRVLRPWGTLIVHTGPNTWFYEYGYPLVRFFGRKLLKRPLPDDYRHESDDVLHVNEQSPLSLYRGLKKAGFRPRVEPRTFSPERPRPAFITLARKVLFTSPFGYFFCQSLIAVARARKHLGESELRTERVLRLASPRDTWKVLLVGRREGALAHVLREGGGPGVTWFEPAPGEAADATRTTGDCRNLPYADGSFDCVVSQMTLEYLDDPLSAIAEWARVLKRGGKLVLVTRNRLFRGAERYPRPRPRRLFSPDELKRQLEGEGCRVVESSTLIPDLKLPSFYRGDLSFSFFFERLPFFRERGMLLFVSGIKEREGVPLEQA